MLLAEPFMADPNFKRSAILLCEHTDEGSTGFILNKSLDMRVDELVADFPTFDAGVYFGGPVQIDSMQYIHNVGELLEGSTKIAEGIYWGGDFNKLKFLISSELIQPDNIRFFLGYSGWSDGQLLDELSLGSWVVTGMDANYLFKSKSDQLWQQAMYNKGDLYTVIANMPDGPSWN